LKREVAMTNARLTLTSSSRKARENFSNRRLDAQRSEAVDFSRTRLEAIAKPARLTLQSAAEHFHVRWHRAERFGRSRAKKHYSWGTNRSGHVAQAAIITHNDAGSSHDLRRFAQRELSHK